MASISDVEFERIQNQLLELKNSNYTLQEKYRRQSSDALQWKEKCETLEKELALSRNLAKLNPLSFAKTLKFNKEHKEKELIDSLNAEKEFYQNKCQSQEDDFKLTNDTLRKEIVKLMSEIDLLNSENVELKTKVLKTDSSENTSNRCNSDSDGEITLQLTPNDQQKTQISYAILSEKEKLENSLDETTNSLKSIKDENQTLKNQVNELSNHNLLLTQNVKQSKETINFHLNEIKSLKNELDSAKKEVVNFKELADKRKSTIDELQCHIEDTSGKAELAIESANKKVNEIKSSLNKELSLLKVEKKDLMNKVEDLQKQLNATKEQCSEFESQYVQSRKEIEQLKTEVKELSSQLNDYEEKKILIEKLEDEKQQIMLRLHDENELKLKELNQLNESIQEQLNHKESLIKKLRQDIEDQIEERKIHDKKGVMIVRDLKKQLNTERKMKERLQEKFGELQSEKSFDLASNGSWSWLSTAKDQNITGKNNSTYSIHSSTDDNLNANGINSPTSDTNSPMPNGTCSCNHVVLEKDNAKLIARLGESQEKIWSLEEKLNKIGLTIEKLKNEIEVKQQIITFYLMDRRTEPIKQQNSTGDKFTVKNLVENFIKDKKDNDLREINRKLQRMIEETLTKNMHLQTNLKLLSDELHSLKNK